MFCKRICFHVFLLLFVIFIGDFVFAEKNKDDQKKKDKKSIFHPHEEIVVTATMTPKAVKDCSASVSVISADDLKALPASNALSLLNNLPGIFISRTGDFGRADVNIRGIGQRGRRIAILVDGRPEKMGLFGCAVTHTFPLDNVERIEIVRGPSSVLYGSEALGGGSTFSPACRVKNLRPILVLHMEVLIPNSIISVMEEILTNYATILLWTEEAAMDIGKIPATLEVLLPEK